MHGTACIYADMISVKSQSFENFMQEGVIKNMTDLQSKYLVKMNDNCRLQNNLSGTKTNTYLDQNSIFQHCTYIPTFTEKLKAKNFYNLSGALSHARTTVISTFYTSFNQSQHCSWDFRAAISLDARCVEGWSFCCMCIPAYDSVRN